MGTNGVLVDNESVGVNAIAKSMSKRNSKDPTVSTTSLSLHVNKVYCHLVSAALYDCSQLFKQAV